MKITRNNTEIELRTSLPVLPLRDVVVFPGSIYPLLIGRQFTVNALQEAMMLDKQVFLCAQKRADEDRPGKDDLYHVGVIARVLQVMKLPNGALKALVEGLSRAKIHQFGEVDQYFSAKLKVLESEHGKDEELSALTRSTVESFSEYVRLNRRIPDEIISSVEGIDDPDQLTDTIAAHILAPLEARQRILECVRIDERLHELATLLTSEIEILKLERKIDTNVRESISQSQRERYLQQQLKAIREELGQGDDPTAEVDELLEKLEALDAPDQVKERAEEEIRRLTRMHPYSAEAAVARGYLDWVFDLPWNVTTKDHENFEEVEKRLDADHHGLEKPKRRIIEHLATLKISKNARGPILCLVGPPGVGKTSIGKSIARALDRKFVRMSLGGVHDEAEIRGHRRTYIGSLPGRIVQGMKRAGSKNPVFLLDEIDKVGADFRGDPSSALLEALDPEQNKTFSDNYLEVDFDLSQTLFITTANSTSTIPHALLDRMEVIYLPGYTENEKIAIATKFLIPKLSREMSLEKVKVEIRESVLRFLIQRYTKEAGVRELERTLASIFRQVAVTLARSKSGRKKKFAFTEREVKKILGPEKFIGVDVKEKPPAGYAVGLAWTEIGGVTLPVEVMVMPGDGKVSLTGRLGEVMQESARAGLSFIRSRAKRFGIDPEFLKHVDIHVHVPEGAAPKDGPSAGITIVVALLSALTDTPARGLVAMTGEITLTGDVIQIGGLNEKLLAAKRAGIKTVILPEKNRKDLAEIKPETIEGLSLRFVRNLDQALKQAFRVVPQAKRGKSGQSSHQLPASARIN